VFSVVWPILYVLIGLSVFGAVAGCTAAGPVLWVYAALALNLLFNLSYPLLMFRARDLKLSMFATWLTLITGVLLLFAVTVSSASTGCTSGASTPAWLRGWKAATPWLLLPYVVWLMFASILATAVFTMNDGDDRSRPSPPPSSP